MSCPLLEYRDGDADRSFDVARAYCTAVDAFVQPMRADICNDRYDLHYADHCEYYREHAGTSGPADDPDATPGAGDGDEPDASDDGANASDEPDASDDPDAGDDAGDTDGSDAVESGAGE